MINRQAILEWSKDHPWQSKSFVEQDLIICRAIVEFDPKTAYARVRKAFLETPFPEN